MIIGMNNTIILDTYDYVKSLKNSKFTEEQVDSLVKRDREQTQALNYLVENKLATKDDITYLKNYIVTFGYLICGIMVIGFSILGSLIVLNH
jgi:hypothetical protein